VKVESLSRLRDVLPGVPLVESPLFYGLIDELDLDPTERQTALDLHERGYAVIDFPDPLLNERAERIKSDLEMHFGADVADPNSGKSAGQRVQDAWIHNEDVRAIAANREVLALLAKLYGRKAFPFQTLNFPVGTQQPLHSDSIHFSAIPERFMCGVWLALEDVGLDAGPLTYLPGSHKWPILQNVMIGRKGSGSSRENAQAPFQSAWDALRAQSETKPETFVAKKGQALIWAANLLHGGSPQRNSTLTRWSQVTHYYFEDCIYYTPAYSDEALGKLDLRVVVDAETEELKPNLYFGKTLVGREPSPRAPSWISRIRRQFRSWPDLPQDFDSDAYYRLNPDVAVARLDPVEHYLAHGRREGRRYRYR
jgi:hypothetical protein